MLREKLRRTSLVVSGVILTSSVGVIVDGGIKRELHRGKLNSEAMLMHPDADSQERLSQAQEILDQIDAQFAARNLKNIRERQEAILDIPRDENTNEALDLLKEQSNIAQKRNDFVNQEMRGKSILEIMIGGVGVAFALSSLLSISIGSIPPQLRRRGTISRR